jgi:DNA segregation ATPase FtsK/SpoIIIE, S-DNA-T family
VKVERVIVLSWIQNFFEIFKKDDEDELVDSDLHIDKMVNLPPPRKSEGSKELDTRISYQYPKGAVPYPLILEETRKTNEQTIHKNRKERHSEARHLEPAVVQTVKKDIPKTKKEPTPRVRGPFHPTEIPSPVFGFNRPNQQDELIVHELSHFSNDVVDFSIAPSRDASKIGVTAPVGEAEDVLFKEHNNEIFHQEKALANEEETISDNNENLQESKEFLLIQHEEGTVNRQEDNEPEQPKSGKTHLPFNVMMLKQDKLKWEERKKRRKEEEKQNPQEELPQVEQPKEVILKTEEFIVEQPKEIILKTEKFKEELKIQKDNVLYEFPVSSLLKPPVLVVNDTEWIHSQEEILNQTLHNFNVGASVVNVTQGPAVTRFEVQPEPGVKVNKITNLSDDIKLSLAARDIRIEAPIPGKHTIGIEVPNQKSRPVLINEIIRSRVFLESSSPLTAVLGLDIAGNPIVTDLKKMPHGLIAGATGSGKSVCINSILVSLLFKASPEDLKLMLIDPKMVELAPYNHIPHLVSPVITDVKAATAALKWAVEEMERRYELFAHTGVRDINRFNELAVQHKRYSDKLPFIVIVIDELADLMMMSPADVEEAICRIAQKARACGIHLIVATQRPSVDVITGLIKANIPTRIAFSVSSQIDSRTIIDISGAEKLLGRGDMLFLENGSSKPVRLQGTFVTDEEIDLVVSHVREQREPEYLFQQEELLKKAQVIEDEDELFYDACEFIIDQGGASTSSLQRRFKIGYNRAARLMDLLETNGYITGSNGSKAREVLITEADLESIQDTSA